MQSKRSHLQATFVKWE